jgi:acyl-CoA thioesterase-1
MDRSKILSTARRASLALCGLSMAMVLTAIPPRAADAGEIRLLALGDSLSAGYGLALGEGFSDQLGAALSREGLNVAVLNGGVSGDTTAGGLARLDWMLSDAPDAVIVELGANDGLRGLDPAQTLANLDAILDELNQRGIPVLLAGMLAPPNMGSEYGEDFNGLYALLADRYDVVFYPFFLEGVAAKPELNQADAIHPNAEGVAEIIRRILPSVYELLARLDG